MSVVPSMVHHRSNNNDLLLVRSTSLADSSAEDAVYNCGKEQQPTTVIKDLPDCKVKRNYTCATCDFFTQNPRLYLYHLRNVHGENVKIYECPSCLYASKHFQKLLRHTKMVHGDSDGCAVATKRPQEQQEEAEHEEELEEDEEEEERNGEEERPPAMFKCSVCVYSVRSQAMLAKHEREEHIKTKFFRCSKCTYVTHIKARYTKHVKYHSMPMIKCDMCDFRTPYKWNLDRHCKNHNGHGAFRCSACNFTADIKQSLTVHEMNHHVPPVGQAAGLGVGRRRNKVGASDTTAAEEAAAVAATRTVQAKNQTTESDDTKKKPKPKIHNKAKQYIPDTLEGKISGGSDFINPDDIVHHANGKVYFKNKCKQCNFKSAWETEMAKHEKKMHSNIDREDLITTTTTTTTAMKKPSRPIPNLIPIPQPANALLKSKMAYAMQEPVMSQKDINDICAKSSNSALKDFASLFGSEDVFAKKVPDLVAAKSSSEDFKQKNASFFDSLREKLVLGTGGNLTCKECGHESKCLTEHAKHQKVCGSIETNNNNKMQHHHQVIPMPNRSSSRCQFCRQRCKSSADLFNHLQLCDEAHKALTTVVNDEQLDEEDSETEGELAIHQLSDDSSEMKPPHPMENRVFVWNDIQVPMELEVDDSNYEYTDDNKLDDNVSLDLSMRTQSPMDSETSSSFVGQEPNTTSTSTTLPLPVTCSDKIPTHGNDISVAQHKRVFKCPHCTFWASTASRFHVHIVGHLNKKPFECSLCAYRSNWRWDITKHIKLKSVRDQAHEAARVLMTDETGRRNYTKYNKYLTEIPVSGSQSMDTSGGCGTRPKNHHERNAASSASSPSTSKCGGGEAAKVGASSSSSSSLKSSPLRPPPALKLADGSFLAQMAEKKRHGSGGEGKRTLFKCKKCNFKDASRDVLLQHVKGHYQQQQHHHVQQEQQQPHQQQQLLSESEASTSELDFIRGTSPDRDEASVNNITAVKGGSPAPFRCGHCNQVSNWKHVIQRHCRLKHSGDIRVVSNKNGQEKIEVEELTDEPDHMDIPQDGTFKCNFCPFSNDDDTEFERHLTGHIPTDDSIYKCCYCKYYVSHNEDLYDHLRLHGITEPEDFLARLSERSSDVDGKKFKCLTCPYVTNSKSQYTYHKQFHKPRGGQYTCTHCSYNVSKRHLLHQHLKVHGVSVATHKQNGEPVYLDEVAAAEEIEEMTPSHLPLDLHNFPDIPLVWVSKNGKFSKMFKCRYCPHVNLRKVNIQEHEKMHSVREKNPNASSRLSDVEHRCTECNYVCNNAGVLSSHSKVHQGMYGNVHALVDPTKTDEEQIKELSRATGIHDLMMPDAAAAQDDGEALETVMEADEVDSSSGSGTVLYFCQECPARFLKENEFGIHKRFHGSRLFYKCEHCSYTSREKPHLASHSKVHTSEYQERTKILQSMYLTSANYNQPKVSMAVKSVDSQPVWIVGDGGGKSNSTSEMSTLCSILSRPARCTQNVPLSGTDLFLQKSEAQQKQAAELAMREPPVATQPKQPELDIKELMRGNPDFIYQPYLKNGRLKEKRYKCHMCPTAFEKREQYKVHLGLHGAQQRYKCDHCDYSVKYYANYVQHLKKHKMNAEAHAARRSSDEADLEIDETVEALGKEDSPIVKPVEHQLASLLRGGGQASVEEKKLFRCTSCPYTSNRKDAVDNHQNRHVSVSGVKSVYTCEHCDYSVPQTHFLREHTKLHFAPNKALHVEGFMSCDNFKLMSSRIDEDGNLLEKDEDDQSGDEKRLIFEECSSEGLFQPPVSADIAERFNNNEGEKRFVNVQSGEVTVSKETSDMQSSGMEVDEECKTEVI